MLITNLLVPSKEYENKVTILIIQTPKLFGKIPNEMRKYSIVYILP